MVAYAHATGGIGELRVAAHLITLGYVVFRNLTGNWGPDLVVWCPSTGQTNPVEVKTIGRNTQRQHVRSLPDYQLQPGVIYLAYFERTDRIDRYGGPPLTRLVAPFKHPWVWDDHTVKTALVIEDAQELPPKPPAPPKPLDIDEDISPPSPSPVLPPTHIHKRFPPASA